jgi:hypothetical protein
MHLQFALSLMPSLRSQAIMSLRITNFEYEPLLGPEFAIRLLKVLPDDGEDSPICVKLWQSTLKQAGKYCCLSYTWGSTVQPYI